MLKLLLGALAATLGTSGLDAQSDLSLRAGLGRVTAGPFDANAINNTEFNLGLAVLDGGSPGLLRLVISHRGNNGGSTPPHSLALWDYDTATGAATLQSTVPQDPATSSSPWGYRDGATDGAGTALFGWEDGIHVLDPTTGALRSTVLATNGPQTVTNPIVLDGTSPLLTGISVPSVYGGIAFDPDGNAGDGSIFVGRFAADIVEISLTGSVLQVYRNNGFNGGQIGWTVSGLALDTDLPNSPGQPALWMEGTGEAGALREFRVVRDAIGPGLGDTVVTGRVLSTPFRTSVGGGLDRAPFPLDGRDFGTDLVQLNQVSALGDLVVGRRVNLHDGAGSDLDLTLSHGFGTSLSSSVLEQGGRLRHQAGSGDSYFLQIDDPTNSTIAQVVYFSFGSSSVPAPLTDAGYTLDNGRLDLSLIEANIPWVTNPSATLAAQAVGGTVTIPSAALNRAVDLDLVGQAFAFVGQNLGPVGLPNRPGTVFGTTGTFFQTSNLTKLEIRPTPRFELRASGPDSFNAITSTGFWTLSNNDPSDTITGVTIDASIASNANRALAFDTDQAVMLDVFSGGNSALPGCAGTVRNGSGVAAGQVFVGTPPASCDPMAQQGWIGSNPSVSPLGPQTVSFQFTPGVFNDSAVFEWDMDTDGGLGSGGADMEGLVVTITTASGQTFTVPMVSISTNTSVAQVF